MTARLRRHITYANVVATLALAFALGGGVVYAANKIGAHGIAKNAIRSYHIRNKQVKRQDIAGGSINGRKVSNDSLTGKDLKEASLGLVPSAQDARTVNGITTKVVRSSQASNSGLTQQVAQGGLTALTSCGTTSATMEVHGAAPGDERSVFEPGGGMQQFTSATDATVNTTDATAGYVTVRRIDGTVTRFEFELVRDDDGFNSSDDCFLHGFLLSGQ
jgi:hypothetical protein